MPAPGKTHGRLSSTSHVRSDRSLSPHRRPYSDGNYHNRPHLHSQPSQYYQHPLPPTYHHNSHVDDGPYHDRSSLVQSTSAATMDTDPYAPRPIVSNLQPSVQRPMNQLVPEQQLQLANISRFTPSCSRCRQKKLKCDTNLPCNQCIAKGVHDECRKDSRVPRGRKRPKLASSSFSKPEDEIASLRKRVKELEERVAQQDQHGPPSEPPSPSVSQHHYDKRSASSGKHGTSSRGSQTTGPSEVGITNSREQLSPFAPSSDTGDEAPGETETSLVTLEKVAASDPRVSEPGHGKAMNKQINNVLPTQISRDGPHPYFARPSTVHERIEILMLAKRLVPAKHIVDELMYNFNLRCHALVGRIVHMPSFRKDVDFFHNAPIEENLTSPHGMYNLARYLMVLRLGMRFYPWKGGMFVDDSTPEFIAINALRGREDDVSKQWLELAKRALAADRTFSLGSLTAVQTALLMILDGRDSPTYLRMLLRISIQTALDMGLHRLGKAMPSSTNSEEDIVRLETGVRIWWYLVVKDWCSAQREGAYTIHPSQMTTRKPLHTTDARLSEGRTDEISLDEHCETSYTLCQIQLANIIRESIDLRNEQSTLGGTYDIISENNKKLLHVKLETFLSDLPPFYRLDSTEMRPGVLAVQRCLLHQQTFDVLLKLNRKDLSSYSERATCALLAEQIVSTQKLIRSVCPVIDGFWVNFLHLFGATLTLTISLLLDDNMDAQTRDRRRSKVNIALATMRETPGSDRGSRIIEMLLEEEQKQWDMAQHQPDSATSRSTLDLATLTRRIVIQSADPTKGPGRPDGTGPVSVSIQRSDHGGVARSKRDGSLTWDTTPDESVVPAFASSWGAVLSHPMDTTAITPSRNPPSDFSLNSMYPTERASPQPGSFSSTRPYEHSLRPWQEPSHAVDSEPTPANHNSLWDWVFSQAALLHGPEPPVEGPKSLAPKSYLTPRSPQGVSLMPPPSPRAAYTEQARSYRRPAYPLSESSSSSVSHRCPPQSPLHLHAEQQQQQHGRSLFVRSSPPLQRGDRHRLPPTGGFDPPLRTRDNVGLYSSPLPSRRYPDQPRTDC